MPAEAIVALMLENRSFDHLVGYLRAPTYPINGPDGNESNYPDPITKEQPPVKISSEAPYVPDLRPGPAHNFDNVRVQLYGANPPPNPSVGTNVGFVADYTTVVGTTHAPDVMRCFDAEKLPALHTLAREFALCDSWFSSIPGPTSPNRFFVHCATSNGYVDNSVRDYNMQTIYDNLTAADINWRVYYHDFPHSLALRNQWRYFWGGKYELFNQAFMRDCAQGRLPAYSFIEPRYANEGSVRANDQHPDHGVLNGDLLIAQVYEALRRSPQWERCLLIIVWDEHGGFYDHQAPPSAIPPDRHAHGFDFRSLGVRVPAVLVSPLIQRNTLCHDTYDHTSILATLKRIFGLPGFLTARDAAAKPFDGVCSLSAPRTNTPITLPRPHPTDVAADNANQSDQQPPNDLQRELVHIARRLDPTVGAAYALAPMPRTEAAAAREMRTHLQAFRASGKTLLS